MENKLLGLLIREENFTWRIIKSTAVTTVGCLVTIDDTPYTRLLFKSWETLTLYSNLLDESIKKLKEEDTVIYPESDMSQEQSEAFRIRKDFVVDLFNCLAPDYETVLGKQGKAEVEKLCVKHGIGKTAAWKYIRIYLQSGMRTNSLLDKRLIKKGTTEAGTLTKNPGRKPDENSAGGKVLDANDMANIQWAIDYFSKHVTATQVYSYIKMLILFYVSKDGMLVDEYPSLRQFRYHFGKQITPDKYAKIKKERSDFVNNCQVLYSTPRNDALRPGQILEADECEMDVIVVSSANGRQILGRPVIYLLVDLYSHVIVAMSVHLHNNSMMGLSSVMLNLFESKEDYCNRFDIKFSCPELWPSCFIPEEIRADQGSEYGSDKFEEVCHSMNIRRSLAPPARGPYKGTVERTFGGLMTLLRPELENAGLIMKRHDSNHYKMAMYTMADITKLCINFVIHHNNMIIDKFKIGREMSMAGVKKSPVEIWKWGVENRGLPTRMVTDCNRAEIMYNVLSPMTARLSKEGVIVKGLRYLPVDDKELASRLVVTIVKGKTETMEVRVDPRDTNFIYYLKDNKVAQMMLVDDAIGNDWKEMDWSEVETEQKIIRDLDRQGQKEKIALRCSEVSNIETILNNAKTSEFKPIKENIRENRLQERAIIDKTESVANRIGLPGNHLEDNTISAPNPITEEVCKDDGADMPKPDECRVQEKTEDLPEKTAEADDIDKSVEQDSPSDLGLSNKNAFIKAMRKSGEFDY